MTQKTNPELRVSQPRTDRCFDTSHSMPVVSLPVEVDIRNCDAIDLLRSLPDNSVDLILTDPPYMISDRKGSNYSAGDWDKEYTMEKLNYSMGLLSPKVKPGGTCIIFFDFRKMTHLYDMMEKHGFKNLRQIFWHKTNPRATHSKSYYHMATEFALVGIKKGAKHTFNSENDKGIYEYPIPGGKIRKHPTQKPEKLFEELIQKHSNKGDLVVDPFLGSGTTAAAAKNTGRRFTGSEINPNYFKEIELRVASCQARAVVVSKPEEFEVSPTYSVGEYVQVLSEDGDWLAKILETREGQVRVEWWYFKDTMPVVSDRVKDDDLVLDNDYEPLWIDVDCIQGPEDVSAYKKRFMVTTNRNGKKRKYNVDKIPNEN